MGADGDGFSIHDTPEQRAVKARLAELREEHRALDAAIEALSSQSGGDALQVARLKKRKLQLKDQIIWAENQITPDIIA
ncbi:MAG: YdcH family protein [Hyphomonadaceae bacterium]